MADRLRGAWLRKHLHPARILLYARLGSTQQQALREVEEGRLAAPALIAAARQTAGHGQRANPWWSDAGSLCATFVLPELPDLIIGQIPLRAGLAVACVLARYLPAKRIHLKWPNDVLLDGKKVAGLLCARRCGVDLIGLGLNVHTDLRRATPEVRARATSLACHLRPAPRRDELLQNLWQAFHNERTSGDWHERYQRQHVLHGRRIRVEEDGAIHEATCRGIDRQGRLLLEEAGTLRAVTNGIVRSW